MGHLDASADAAQRRHILSKAHSVAFEAAYRAHGCRRPLRADIDRLSAETGIEFQRIYNWFSNRITRDKHRVRRDDDRATAATATAVPAPAPGAPPIAIDLAEDVQAYGRRCATISGPLAMPFLPSVARSPFEDEMAPIEVELSRLQLPGVPCAHLHGLLTRYATHLQQFKTMEGAAPQFFRVGLVVWTSVQAHVSGRLRQHLVPTRQPPLYALVSLPSRCRSLCTARSPGGSANSIRCWSRPLSLYSPNCKAVAAVSRVPRFSLLPTHGVVDRAPT